MRLGTVRLSLAAVALAVCAIPIDAAGQSASIPPDSGAKHITILQTTDIHDHANGADHTGLDIDGTNATALRGAYSRIAAYINHVRATAGNPVIVVDSGDWTMGTLYDLTLGDRPLALYFLQTIGYDCVTLGNHEFDYTSAGLARMLGAGQSGFGFNVPIVATNMDIGGDADLAPFVDRGNLIDTTHVQELPNGLRIGYIGLMGRNAVSDIATAAPVTFWDVPANYARIQAQVDALRHRGVKIVIALSHSGTNASGTAGEDIDLATHVRGIDVIASGHTHTPLPHATAVQNGDWTTQIVDAGFAGTNVSRVDLTYHPSTRTTTFDASVNPLMTDAFLASLSPGLTADSSVASVVRVTDQQLNTVLGPFFTQTFSDYNAANVGTGIYHPIGATAQDMVSNETSLVPPPNGLGDLVSDAIRGVGNAIIAQTLAAVGGNTGLLPGFDFTPIQAAVVPSGLLRGTLQTGVPLSFADVYNVQPLGISPDPTQPLPIAYPLISAYVDSADVNKICALQLVAQSGLVPADLYVNVSGIQCGISTAGSYSYFKIVTATGVLQTTSQKAAAGSVAAIQAIAALSTLGTDAGSALLAAASAGNLYAGAMIKLNDASPTSAEIAANLAALGHVAAAAAADSTNGTATLIALITSNALAAIGTVAGFAPTDAANVGVATPLPTTGRIRVVLDLFTLLAVGSLGPQLGLAVTAYQSASGAVVLSANNFAAILANRLDAAPVTPGVQELKAWMALLTYIRSGLGGSITSAYASTANFAQFGTFGIAVTNRNAAYPVGRIAQLLTTLGGLQAAP